MTTDQSSPELTYTQEQVQQILNLAIAQQAYEGEFSYTQLVEIAEELGISPTALNYAAQALQTQRSELVKRQNFDTYLKANLRKQVGRYAIANSSFILLNLLMGFSTPWSLYIALLWGLRLGLNAWNVYHTQDEAYEKAFQRWERKHQLQQKVNNWLERLLSA
ncbi:MAG: Pr2TM family membrane protein [Acaryochloris sp. RU_4_1]|nr:Pr2TM family membrane protein [Acaryochloris sp. SU_5_25]NJM66356.1 Pr2TM family membrane protein [Acaryochloris sp. RU_4_1]NJN38739.1 Pr2TM family membrane protein [Acaryochloridaceae cyanobacterium CSU_3_4]NJR54991.1 Pr2TM family membrane protein [Acaryochloris sp. CRU_2_0]